MSKDLHNEDEYFQVAYRHYEENPSPEVWEKINARLDKTDAVYYRRRYAVWMRFACALLLLLASTSVYEIWQHNNSNSTTKVVYVKGNTLPAIDSAALPKKSHSKNFTEQGIRNPQQKATDKNHIYEPSTESSGAVYHHRNYNNHLRAQGVADSGELYSQNVQDTSLTQSYQQQQFVSMSNGRSALLSHWKNYAKRIVLPIEKESENSVVKVLRKDDGLTDEMHVRITDSVGINSMQNSLKIPTNDSLALSHAPQIKHEHATKHGWEILPHASLDFTRYYLDNDVRENGVDPTDKNDIEGSEKNESSYSAGVLARWHFSKKMALKTGLLYSNIVIGIQPQTLYATRDNNQGTAYKFITSSGFAYVKPLFGTTPLIGDSITSDLGQHRLNYLGLPVMLSYPVLHKKRLSLLTSAGVNANLLLSTKIETDVNDNIDKQPVIINKLIGLRPIYFSFIADAELQYHISKHVSTSAIPVIKYAFTSQTKNYIVKTYPYSLSLGVGLSYTF